MSQKSIKLTAKVLRIASHSLLTTGVLFALLSMILLYSHYNPTRLSFSGTAYEKEEIESRHLKVAKRLIIHDIAVDLPIVPAAIKDGVWETTDKGVSHLMYSPVPGSYGNSILYGHNWSELLANLEEIGPGNTFEIEFSDGSIESFTVHSAAYVSPKDIAVLAQTEESLVTLYTCAGPLDSKRYVLTARPSQSSI